MADEFDQIPVLRIHLEEIYRAVDAAYGKMASLDLARAYDTMSPGFHRPSNLTRALEAQKERVEGYLTPPEE
jgi:hypothetical protein